MKPALVIGVMLIVLGVVALAYQGISYTTKERKKVLDIGPLQATAVVERERRFPLPPILGVSALIGGVVLVIVGSKK